MSQPCEGDDLPDHDYASIYGAEMLHARQLALFRHRLQCQDRIVARLETILARMEARSEHLDARPLGDTP